MQIRDFAPTDLFAALQLNQAALPAVNGHDPDSFAALVGEADRSGVADDEGTLWGLLVSFTPRANDTSQSYRWLQERFEQLSDVDRIIISPDYQRRGRMPATPSHVFRTVLGALNIDVDFGEVPGIVDGLCV